MPRTFLTAEWRKLIMAQYAVEPATLLPYLPAGTELDLFRGECLVSMVGFLFDRVRVLGMAIPFHTRFDEVNLRFYVRRTEPDGTRKRGVVFVQEIVPRAAITTVANLFYEEPYRTLPTHHLIDERGDTLHVAYGWRHPGRWNTLAVEASRVPEPIAPGSVEEFITEHYWGYTKRSNGSTSQYEVKHPSWAMYPVRRTLLEVDFAALYGQKFAMLDGCAPDHVLLAEGSAVSVDTGSTLPR